MENEKTNEIPRILIVEDDEAARLSLKASLEAENMFVEAVENGANAENMIKYSSFDVVIVDYRLPDIDGLNLIKKMKLIVPDIMTLVVTAHTSVEIAVDAMRMGAYDYMSKPLDIENLVNTIYKIINDKKDLYTSKQMLSEMVTKKSVDYLFNDEQVAVITAPNSNILVEGKPKGSLFKSIKKFFVGIKNYYWGA
jgi:DNA-binding NtrC family response regulator